MMDTYWLHPLSPCRNKLCERTTTALYCCGRCVDASEGRYEIHEDGPLSHSDKCNERTNEDKDRLL